LGKTVAVADNPIPNCCGINAERLADDGQRLTQRYPAANLRGDFRCVDVLPRSIRLESSAAQLPFPGVITGVFSS
jgi:hypothetical protein